MKNVVFGVILGVILMGFMALTEVNKEPIRNINNQLQTDKDLSLARVQKMSGKLVFLGCEPVNDYDVAFEIKGFTLGNFDTPNEISNFVIKNALKISAKEKKEFDGVIIGSGKVDIAIKFK